MQGAGYQGAGDPHGSQVIEVASVAHAAGSVNLLLRGRAHHCREAGDVWPGMATHFGQRHANYPLWPQGTPFQQRSWAHQCANIKIKRKHVIGRNASQGAVVTEGADAFATDDGRHPQARNLLKLLWGLNPGIQPNVRVREAGT